MIAYSRVSALIGCLLYQGDSGGPLACFDGEKWVQQGITSHGTGTCGERTFYSNISLYLDSIHAGEFADQTIHRNVDVHLF